MGVIIITALLVCVWPVSRLLLLFCKPAVATASVEVAVVAKGDKIVFKAA